MKTLFLTTHLNTGGITSYLLTLTKGLIARGHKVYLISSGGNTEEEFEAMGVRLHNLNFRTKSDISPKIYFSIPIIKSYINEYKIDIVHAHTRITQIMGCILKFNTKIPYLSTCHGFFKTR